MPSPERNRELLSCPVYHKEVDHITDSVPPPFFFSPFFSSFRTEKITVKDSYWLTNGNGRFRHMSECMHQSEDTQDKARIRLQRYLAMARQRMKARHEREKLEKRKKKSLLLGG